MGTSRVTFSIRCFVNGSRTCAEALKFEVRKKVNKSRVMIEIVVAGFMVKRFLENGLNKLATVPVFGKECWHRVACTAPCFVG